MAINQELEHACDEDLSTEEVVEILRKYQSLPVGDYFDSEFEKFGRATPPSDGPDPTTWDYWEPLAAHLDCPWWITSPPKLPPLSDPILNIWKNLRGRIISWLCDVKRDRNMFWIVDPLESLPFYSLPKPPRDSLKTLMVICTEIHRFGAHFLLRGMDDIIAALANQLAARYPLYRRLLARELVDDPNLLEQPLRCQFKKLIINPWKALQISHPRYIVMPPVIVLDHCDSDPSVSELLELICEYSGPGHRSPLLWVVCCHLKGRSLRHSLGEPVLPIPSEYIKLSFDDDGVPRDTELILRHRFNQFRDEHKEMFDENEVWPSGEQMSRLVRVVSGVFPFVNVLLRFMDRGGSGGPQAQLETFLTYMVDCPSPSDLTPYCTLDHFYSRVLSAIPPDIFPDAMRIAECLYRGYSNAIPRHVAHLLGLDQGSFTNAFTGLERAVLVEGDFKNCSLDFLFTGFLENPSRSGDFSLPRSPLLGVGAYLRVLDESYNFFVALKAMRWTPQEPLESSHAVCDLIDRALDRVWELPFSTPPEDTAALYRSFHHFDFRCLVYRGGKIFTEVFLRFLRWLHPLGQNDSTNLVRTEPSGFSDLQFIQKCGRLSVPLDLKSEGEIYCPSPRYALLGFGAQAVLVLFPVDVDPGDVEFSLVTRGVDIYSPEMLDDM